MYKLFVDLNRSRKDIILLEAISPNNDLAFKFDKIHINFLSKSPLVGDVLFTGKPIVVVRLCGDFLNLIRNFAPKPFFQRLTYKITSPFSVKTPPNYTYYPKCPKLPPGK